MYCASGFSLANARDQHEDLGIFQQLASELGERLQRQAAHWKLVAGVGIENDELARRSDLGMDRAELPPDPGGRAPVRRNLRHLEAVHRPRPFHARHLLRRRVESVHQIEERVGRMDVPVVQHLVCQQIAGVQPFLVEPVETDAPASAGQVAQHAAVPDEGFHVDHGVDAATAGTPQKQQRVAHE